MTVVSPERTLGPRHTFTKAALRRACRELVRCGLYRHWQFFGQRPLFMLLLRRNIAWADYLSCTWKLALEQIIEHSVVYWRDCASVGS
jgi:hypothetical protein